MVKSNNKTFEAVFIDKINKDPIKIHKVKSKKELLSFFKTLKKKYNQECPPWIKTSYGDNKLEDIYVQIYNAIKYTNPILSFEIHYNKIDENNLIMEIANLIK